MGGFSPKDRNVDLAITSDPIGNYDRQADRPTNRRTWGVTEKFHFQLFDKNFFLKENTNAILKKLEDDTDEKIEELIDDISTNEMFGSSILSMET